MFYVLNLHVCVEKSKKNMAHISQISVLEEQVEESNPDVSSKAATQTDELTIKISSHISGSDLSNTGAVKIDSGQTLAELFDDTLKEKGEYPLTKAQWTGPGELEVEGLSNITLHSFLLKTEALGKKVSYSRNLTVKIED